MKKVLFTVFGLMVGFTLMGMAFAQFRLPKKQKDSPPPSESRPSTARPQTRRCTEGALRGQRFCPDGRTAYRQELCRNGRWVWEDRMNESDCPQAQAEQPPAEQAPAEQPAQQQAPAGEQAQPPQGQAPAQQAEQEAVQCTDSDNSQVENGQLRLGEDRLVRGIVRGRSRVDDRAGVSGDMCMPNGTLMEYFCANATDISGSTVQCRQGEVCQNGACVGPIVLNRCGTPEGGWQNGKTYILSGNVAAYRDHPYEDEITCFDLAGENITLDCQGHSIRRSIVETDIPTEQTVGILAGEGLHGGQIKNCTIMDHGVGLKILGSHIEINNNTIRYNVVSGIDLSSHFVHFINNTACNSGRYYENYPNTFDINCHTVFSLEGSGNYFGHLNTCEPPLGVYPPTVYTACEAN